PGPGTVRLTASLDRGARLAVYGPNGLVDRYSATGSDEHRVEAPLPQGAASFVYLDNPTGDRKAYTLQASWTSGASAPATSPPGSVILADSFDDSTAGVLPTALSPSPNQWTRGYENGQYRIRQLDPRYPSTPTVDLPGAYADTSLAVTARAAEGSTDSYITLSCRASSEDDSGYRLVVWPGTRTFGIERWDDGD